MIAPAVIAGCAGLVVGSFVTTAALRSVRGQQALRGRSACDGCGVVIGYAASVPIVSYLQRRGACQACGGPINTAHPIGEAAGGLGACLAVLILPPYEAALAFGLGLCLLASAVVDARTRRLPNLLTFGVAVLGLALAAFQGREALLQGAGASLLTLTMLLIVRRLSARQGREASLGLGDVKLAAALALWLGLLTPWAVALAAVIGLGAMALIRPQDGKISFGPALALAGWLVGVVSQAGLWPGQG